MSNHILPVTDFAYGTRRFSTQSPQRILVVDNDPYVCHLSADVLIRHGFEVNAAEDGAAAWDELRSNPYNLLITELDLPKLTGVKLVIKLRVARMAVPVVMVAGRLPTAELARNPTLRLAATLLKPIGIAALLDTVKTVLRAADGPRDQIAPPPNTYHSTESGVHQFNPTSSPASAARQLSQETHKTYDHYPRWGLNE